MTGQEKSVKVEYLINPAVTNTVLNALFTQSWDNHEEKDFTLPHQHSLAYIEKEVVGYVNIAWDGNIHGFVLNPTVHPKWRRKGIGTGLLQKTAQVARESGIHWLHVDYEPHLKGFYHKFGFRHTEAGLLSLGN